MIIITIIVAIAVALIAASVVAHSKRNDEAADRIELLAMNWIGWNLLGQIIAGFVVAPLVAGIITGALVSIVAAVLGLAYLDSMCQRG